MSKDYSVSTNWQALFEESYSRPASVVQERVWREVFGEEYPEGIDPYSYVSRTELLRFVSELRAGPGKTLVDVGCGRGGAGLWVAITAGCELIGIDIAENALSDARTRASALGFPATFRQGSFEATGLPDGAANAVMSIDALLFTPDKSAALGELRRIIQPGGRLVLTSWDYHSQPAGRPPQVPDHRPLLAANGWQVAAYEETEHWYERIAGTGEGLLRAVEELAAEEDAPPEQVRQGILEMNATLETMARRFFLVATAV